MNRKILGLLAIFVVLASISIASARADSDKIEFSGDFDKVITSDEVAIFELALQNNNAPTSIELSIGDDFGWEIEFSDTEISVSKGDEHAFDITLTPPEHVEAKTYFFELHATSDGESLGAITLEVSIGKDITPIVLKELDLPRDFYPGQTVPVTLVLYNNNFYSETNVKLTIESSALEEPFSVIKSFDGKETKTLTGELTVAPFLEAGKYTVFVRGSNGKIYTIYEKKINVPAEGSMVVEEDIHYGFLKSTHTVTITNKANYVLEDVYKLNVGGASRFFTFVTPEADRRDGGTYEYDISLASGESTVIEYTVSYLPMIIGFVLLALLVLWFYSRKKCRIEKRVIATKGADGKSMVKVSIRFKNKLHKTLRDIQITDRVPASLKLVHRASSMRPDIIKQRGSHAVLTWKIPKLEPREERIVSYYVKASVRLVGRVSLPPAELLLKSRTRTETYISNSALLRSV